ncbi:MAG: glycosyltransferase [Dorea sp.]|nr:glycosyltransferase [Dorea sp.]
MEKILTITVPSYNVEKFLNQTLNSFIHDEILDDIEVLIVDDGSKDHTAEIGKEYEEKYPQSFRVISKENGGHGSTINRGIAEAKGRYFKVVDGDDWVNTEDFVRLIQKLKGCSADYVFTNYYEVNDVTKEKNPVTFPGIRLNEEMPFHTIAKETKISMHAVVIETRILKEHNIRLDEHCFYVDVEYILYPIPYVEKVVYFDIYVYMYRLAQVGQSVSMQGYQKHMQNHIDVIMHVLDYIENYKKTGKAEEDKVRYMERRIGEMAHEQVDIFTSFPVNNKEIQKKFQDFDEALKKKSLTVYHETGEYSGMLRMLRKVKFWGYEAIVNLSKVRNK